MKIALIIAVWKRHDLEKIVIDSYIEQSKKFGFEIIIAGSEGARSKRLAKGCHYLEVDNSPLSKKHNEMLLKAKELDMDGVVLMGSDDLVSDSYWEWVYSQDMKGEQLLGLKDFYFYSTRTKELSYWGGYKQGKQVAGAGRLFTKAVLDKLNWKLWSDDKEHGLDSDCSQRLLKFNITEKSTTMAEMNAFLVDIKHTVSITSQSLISNCKKANFDIMAKAVNKKVVEKVEKLEQPKEKKKKVIVSDLDPKLTYTFVSNGSSEHLKKGGKFKIDGAMANQLIIKGYGNVE